MTERDKPRRRHDRTAQGGRTEASARREPHDVDAEMRQLQREMDDFEQTEELAKQEIEAEVLKEHWGHEPPRPLEWKEPPAKDR